MELIIKETEGYAKKEPCEQKPVFTINNDMLIKCTPNGCKKIAIPTGIKTIGKDCFTGTDVEEVILPEGIERIEPCAFANCTELKKINFPETLNVIKDRVFLNCHLLTEVILPETLAELGNYAFYDTGIKKLVLPKRATLVGVSTFGSIKIETIDIPKDFTLGKSMFFICQNLRAVNFEADQVTIPEKCFYHCTSLAEIDINKALSIKDSAFLKCYNLSVSTIPAHAYVETYAFSETGVTDVTIEDISKIGKGAFAECNSLKKLTINVADGLEAANGLSIPEELVRECRNLQTVIFTGHTENLLSIKKAAFEGTEMLTEISLPDNIRLIEKYAFYDSGIKNIHLPENLEQIGNYAFAMSNLESITVPDKVAELGVKIFSGCYKLTEVVLPELITAIPDEAFLACHKLKTVHVSGISTVGDSAFFHCKALKVFDFSQIKKLGGMSFAETGIREAIFSNKLTKLQVSSFCDCKDLQSIDMSACNKLKAIPLYCFEGCSKLTNVKLPPNVCKFDDSCFDSVKFDRLVINAGTRVNFHAFYKVSINELEFIDDTDEFIKTVVDILAFEDAKVGRLIIPDHMYDRFKEAISQIQ